MPRKRMIPSQGGRRDRREGLAARERAFALYDRDDPSEALAVASQAMTHPLSSVVQVDLLHLAAVCHVRLGDAGEAISCWRKLLHLQPDHAEIHNNLGNLLREQNRPTEAESAYRQALGIHPDHADAHYNLGLLLHDQHRLAEAEVAYRQVLRIDPNHARACHNLANLLQALQRFAEAEAVYRHRLTIHPVSAESCLNLGHLLQKGQRLAEAEAAYRWAVRIDPDHAEGYNSLGWLLYTQKRFEAAEAAYRQVLRLHPFHVEACNNLGNLLQEQRRWEAAEAVYRLSLSAHPQCAETHNNLGHLLHRLRRNQEAEESFRLALEIKPDYTEACLNLGYLLQGLKRWEAAEATYRSIVDRHPDGVDAHHALGNLLQERGHLEESEAAYRRALQCRPDHVESLLNLGLLLTEQLRLTEAAACCHRAMAIRPDCAVARWSLAFMSLFSGWHGPRERAASREAWRQEIALLYKWFEDRQWRFGAEAVGSRQPFFLAYQEEDNREMLTRYGDLCVRLMDVWYHGDHSPWPPFRATLPSSGADVQGVGRSGPAIRVGVVSKYFYNHSVWHAIMKGWFCHFDPQRFQLLAFCTGNERDEETRCAQALSDLTIGPQGLHEWVQSILAAQPDLLIYPEVGMNSLAMQLAALRLAPVQMVAWGHPETTGLSTIDGYLSAELFEAEDSARYYSEQLIKLPNLGTCCARMTTDDHEVIHPAQFGLCADRPILICAGTSFKYDPCHDGLFIELVRQMEGCQLVFFNHPKYEAIRHLFAARLEGLFQSSPYSYADHVFFLPWLPADRFHGLLRVSTLMLDPIGFSGFNTVLQAVECGLPVVTLDGRFLRGRLGAGILRRLGLADTIAQDREAYIDLAVRFGTDETFRAAIRYRLSKALPVLFDDMEPIEKLQNIIEEVVQKTPLRTTRRRQGVEIGGG